MRECWINVYCSDVRAHCGAQNETRADAEAVAASITGAAAYVRPAYRLHVRLKAHVGAVSPDGCRYVEEGVLTDCWVEVPNQRERR